MALPKISYSVPSKKMDTFHDLEERLTGLMIHLFGL